MKRNLLIIAILLCLIPFTGFNHKDELTVSIAERDIVGESGSYREINEPATKVADNQTEPVFNHDWELQLYNYMTNRSYSYLLHNNAGKAEQSTVDTLDFLGYNGIINYIREFLIYNYGSYDSITKVYGLRKIGQEYALCFRWMCKYPNNAIYPMPVYLIIKQVDKEYLPYQVLCDVQYGYTNEYITADELNDFLDNPLMACYASIEVRRTLYGGFDYAWQKKLSDNISNGNYDGYSYDEIANSIQNFVGTSANYQLAPDIAYVLDVACVDNNSNTIHICEYDPMAYEKKYTVGHYKFSYDGAKHQLVNDSYGRGNRNRDVYKIDELDNSIINMLVDEYNDDCFDKRISFLNKGQYLREDVQEQIMDVFESGLVEKSYDIRDYDAADDLMDCMLNDWLFYYMLDKCNSINDIIDFKLVAKHSTKDYRYMAKIEIVDKDRRNETIYLVFDYCSYDGQVKYNDEYGKPLRSSDTGVRALWVLRQIDMDEYYNREHGSEWNFF